jgi:hypothetical protein
MEELLTIVLLIVALAGVAYFGYALLCDIFDI